MARSGARPRLDEAAVLRAAAELVDAEGLDVLSLARLASALGVQTPSLYNHVAGLEGLRRGLALLGVRELRDRLARAAIGVSGASAVYAIAEAYRRFAKEHPGLYAASLRAPSVEETELTRVAGEILDIIRAALGAYALRGEEEIHVLRAFRTIAHGFVSLELAGGFGMPVDLDASYRVLVDLLLAGLERRPERAG
jgi:AcrR family transcriptional regulator